MKAFKVIANCGYWLLFVLLAFTSVALILSNLNTPIRYRVFNISSGSMYPTIGVGSLVVVVPSDLYQIGDIVTFKSSSGMDSTVTHRIYDVQNSGSVVEFITKGDANKTPDIDPVLKQAVLGRVLFSVPLIGFPIAYSRTQLGFILLVIVPATILVYSETLSMKSELSNMIKKGRSKKEKISSLFESSNDGDN